MKSLLVCLVLVSIASIADAQQYRGGFGRNGAYSAVVQRRPIYRQQQGYYRPQRQLQAVPLFGYSYGPNIYGDYSSAFHPSPVFQQAFVNDPYYMGW